MSNVDTIGLVKLMGSRRGANGVSTNGGTAILYVFDRGTFQVLLLTHFCIPKSARAYLSPKSVKIITFAAAPLALTPVVRNQGHYCGFITQNAVLAARNVDIVLLPEMNIDIQKVVDH